MKNLECNKIVYRLKMALAIATFIAAWLGPILVFYFHVFHA